MPFYLKKRQFKHVLLAKFCILFLFLGVPAHGGGGGRRRKNIFWRRLVRVILIGLGGEECIFST